MQRNRYSKGHWVVQVRIKENSWVAKLAAAKLKADRVAIVFGRTIHLHRSTREDFLKETDWVCHELKHVEQYRQNGFVFFMAKYLLESIRSGYHQNKFEVEARESERDLELIEKAIFI